MTLDATRWQETLTLLLEKHGVPGASLAVWSRGRTIAVAAGVLNIETQVEATPDSVFQVGSTTKAFTAAVVMRLVEEGRLDLDRPIVDYVPEFSVPDAEVTQSVTLRHLLTHTSGIDGDNFTDTGRGDDALARYLETCRDLSQAVPFGAVFSYCNTGYAIIGRVIESVTGSTYDAALRELLLEPLGLTRSVTLAEDAVRFRIAYGHVPGPDRTPVPAPYWATPRSMGPAGGIVATAEDVLTFARCLLGRGRVDDRRVLTEESVALMHAAQVEVPDKSIADEWGVGLMLQSWEGTRLAGHDGGTVGQGCLMRWAPDHDFAVTLVCNSNSGGSLFHDVLEGLADDLLGVHPPAPLVPKGTTLPPDADEWVGLYERMNFRLRVERADDALRATAEIGGLAAAAHSVSTIETPLLPAGGATYLAHLLSATEATPITFFQLADGSRYAHVGGRAQPRVDD